MNRSITFYHTHTMVVQMPNDVVDAMQAALYWRYSTMVLGLARFDSYEEKWWWWL